MNHSKTRVSKRGLPHTRNFTAYYLDTRQRVSPDELTLHPESSNKQYF